MDKEFLSFEVKFRVNDILYKQHMETQFKLNTAIIFIQLGALILSIVLQIFNINITSVVCGINLVLCALVMINNFINDTAWNKAKKRQKIEVDDLIDILNKQDIKAEEIAKALGMSVPYTRPEFDKLLEPDDDANITRLKLLWRENAMLNKATGVSDANGVEYHTGDIVFNPSIGDYWLVVAVDEATMKYYDSSVPYLFLLYGNEDEYAMSLAEPRGFTIELRVTDFAYVNVLLNFIKVYKKHKDDKEQKEGLNNDTTKADDKQGEDE